VRFSRLFLVVGLLSSGTSTAAPGPSWGYDLSAIDRSVHPGDDFYRFANGRWIGRTAIPEDKTNVGLIAGLSDRVAAQIQSLVQALSRNGGIDQSEAKIGRFYRAFMDERRLTQLGVIPLRSTLVQIGAARDRSSLARLAGSAPMTFAAAPFALSIDPDGKDPQHYSINVDQSGIGLPNRDYYLKPEFARERVAYARYIARLLSLVGWQSPDANAGAILALETRIAQASWTDEQRRNPNATYQPIRIVTLERIAPQFDWPSFLEGADLRGQRKLVLDAGSAVPAIARVWGSTPVSVLQA